MVTTSLEVTVASSVLCGPTSQEFSKPGQWIHLMDRALPK